MSVVEVEIVLPPVVEVEVAFSPVVEVEIVTGARGPSGAGSALAYLHTQSVPASTWIIPHNLGYRPNIQIFDSSGAQIIAPMVVTNTTATLTFLGIMSGEAHLS